MGARFDGPERQAEARRGPRGDTGPRGNGILHGAGAPGTSVGTQGDFYIDTLHWHFYGPKVEAAWPLQYAEILTQGDYDVLMAAAAEAVDLAEAQAAAAQASAVAAAVSATSAAGYAADAFGQRQAAVTAKNQAVAAQVAAEAALASLLALAGTPGGWALYEDTLLKEDNLAGLVDKAASFDVLETTPPDTWVPSSPNLILEKSAVSLLDMMDDAKRQDVRDGTNTGNYSPYLQAMFDSQIDDPRDGTLPYTPTPLRLETAVVATLPDRGTSSLVSSFTVIGKGLRNTRFLSYVAGGPAIKLTHELAGTVGPGDPGYVTSGYLDFLLLRGFSVNPGGATDGDGLFVENLFNARIDAIECAGHLGYGFKIAAYANPDTDTSCMPEITRCRFTGNDQGIVIGAQTSGSMAASQARFERNWISGNRLEGISASGFSQLELLYNSITANGANGGANDFGGMHVWVNGVHPRNLYMRGNEFGNGNRAHSLRVDGISNFFSQMDRWVTNAAAMDYATPVSIKMGDGTSTCRNWKIDRPQLVVDASVTHTFLQLASTATVANNGSLVDPDYLSWTAGPHTLINEPSKLAELRATAARVHRERSRPIVLKTISTTANQSLDLNEASIFRLYCIAATINITTITGGTAGMREGEMLQLVVENRSAGAITVNWPTNMITDGWTSPAAGKMKTATFVYYTPLAKFVPVGPWSADLTP